MKTKWHVSVHTRLIVKESSLLWSAKFCQQRIIFRGDLSFWGISNFYWLGVCLLRKLPLTYFFLFYFLFSFFSSSPSYCRKNSQVVGIHRWVSAVWLVWNGLLGYNMLYNPRHIMISFAFDRLMPSSSAEYTVFTVNSIFIFFTKEHLEYFLTANMGAKYPWSFWGRMSNHYMCNQGRYWVCKWSEPANDTLVCSP